MIRSIKSGVWPTVLLFATVTACRPRNPQAARIDPDALVLLSRVEATLLASPAIALDATVETYMPNGHLSSRARHSLKFVRPRLILDDVRSRSLQQGDTLGPESHAIIGFNGDKQWNWDASYPQYA